MGGRPWLAPRSEFVTGGVASLLIPLLRAALYPKGGSFLCAAMRYYLSIMPRGKRNLQQEPLKVMAVKLPPTAEQTLHRLSQEASDRIGWTVSHSAVLRALVSYAERQPLSWALSELVPLIEQEIATGRVWGSKKRR